jgi:hypothetical protein
MTVSLREVEKPRDPLRSVVWWRRTRVVVFGLRLHCGASGIERRQGTRPRLGLVLACVPHLPFPRRSSYRAVFLSRASLYSFTSPFRRTRGHARATHRHV